MIQARTRLPAEEVRAIVRSIPSVLAGRLPDRHGIRAALVKRLSLWLLERVRKAFRSKTAGRTGEDGIRWTPLKASTRKARKRKGQGQGILKATGALYASLASVAGRVAVTATAPHAGLHHRGTRRIPARPLWPEQMPPAMAEALADEAALALAEILGRVAAGGRA